MARDPDKRDVVLASELLTSIRDASRHLTTLTVSMLAVAAYLWIATATVTHEALLRGSSLAMPLVDVALPINSFFIWAPPLLLLLHVNVLLHLLNLHRRISRLKKASPSPWVRWVTLLPSLASQLDRNHAKSSAGLDGLQRLILVLIYLSPLVVMDWMLWAFLPYQGSATYFQAIYIVLDAALIYWCFVYKGNLVSFAYQLTVTGGVILLLVAGLWLTITPPGHPVKRLVVKDLVLLEDSRASRLRAGTDCLEIYLVLEANDDKWKGLDLSGRSLRGANFAGSCLLYADLRGADLEGANLQNADLSGADLGPRDAEEWPGWVESEGTRRRLVSQIKAYGGDSTNLKDVDLRGARLVNSDLTLANLDSAILHRANLRNSVMVEANLRSAQLHQAILTSVDLYGASLLHSKLHGVEAADSDFRKSLITGADFTDANLDRTDMRDTEGYLPSFAGARMRCSKFNGSAFIAGDFERSDLRDAEGLFVHLNRLAYANVWGADLCPGSKGQAMSTDLRGVVGKATCLPDFNETGLGGMPSEQEVEVFFEGLARTLLYQACSDEEVALAVASNMECNDKEFYDPHEAVDVLRSISNDCLLSRSLRDLLNSSPEYRCDLLSQAMEEEQAIIDPSLSYDKYF